MLKNWNIVDSSHRNILSVIQITHEQLRDVSRHLNDRCKIVMMLYVCDCENIVYRTSSAGEPKTSKRSKQKSGQLKNKSLNSTVYNNFETNKTKHEFALSSVQVGTK